MKRETNWQRTQQNRKTPVTPSITTTKVSTEQCHQTSCQKGVGKSVEKSQTPNWTATTHYDRSTSATWLSCLQQYHPSMTSSTNLTATNGSLFIEPIPSSVQHRGLSGVLMREWKCGISGTLLAPLPQIRSEKGKVDKESWNRRNVDRKVAGLPKIH